MNKMNAIRMPADVLLLAYERAPVGSPRLLYKLVEISAKEGNFQDAELFYKDVPG